MHLDRIQLTEFRSYHALDLAIPGPGLVLTGQNAAGKSSLLEAVRMLSILRSPRAVHDREVINWTSGKDLDVSPYARLVGHAGAATGTTTIELGLQIAEEASGPLRKQIKINQQPRRVVDSVGTLRTVLFTPDDLDLVSGSPSGRRRFMDLLISQIDRRYVSTLSQYTRVVEQRNSLLKTLAKGGIGRSQAIEQLGFWDEQLINLGAQVSASRRVAMGQVSRMLDARAETFASTTHLSARYVPGLGTDFEAAARIGDPAEHVLAVAQREFGTQVRMRRDDELRRGVTIVGPHRDDLSLQIDGRSLALFGSRGQQRLGVMALKLAEADVVAAEGEMPVLLLDDILSELDNEHRSRLLESIVGFGAQVLITSADKAQVSDSALASLTSATVRPGGIAVDQ